jgi:hypothetical protein
VTLNVFHSFGSVRNELHVSAWSNTSTSSFVPYDSCLTLGKSNKSCLWLVPGRHKLADASGSARKVLAWRCWERVESSKESATTKVPVLLHQSIPSPRFALSSSHNSQLVFIPSEKAPSIPKLPPFSSLSPTISHPVTMAATQLARISGRISLRTASKCASGLSLSHNAIAYD